MKRVVVTGIGVVSCLGNNQEEIYQSLLNSKSGITFSEEYKEFNLKSHVHGIPNIKLEDFVDRKVTENKDVVEFELCSALDLAGVRIPKRQCLPQDFPGIGTFHT